MTIAQFRTLVRTSLLICAVALLVLKGFGLVISWNGWLLWFLIVFAIVFVFWLALFAPTKR